MKKKLLFPLLSLVAFAPLTVGVVSQHAAIQVHASDYVKTPLPTTINLNPVSENDIRSYYSALDGKSLQGNELLKALKPILATGQQHFSYDANSGREIWQAYEITDRDWTLSPADKIIDGKYDDATNMITGYVYGTSVSKPGNNNPYLHLLYRNQSDTSAKMKAWDTHGIISGVNGFDREHIWPKSIGFDDSASGKYGARGDLHHLLPGDHDVNSSLHNNNCYGFVDLTKAYTNGGTKYAYNTGNYLGYSVSDPSSPDKVFEPCDADKGDIARAVFYMAARYNNIAGDDATIDSGNPNLLLCNSAKINAITSTASKAAEMGILQDLLAWHRLDPVDEFEIHRNDLIFRNFSKNRNPFIDFPEWADAIWGTVVLDEGGRSIKSHDATPKGVAAPNTDKIYNQGSGGGGSSSSASSQSSSSAPATSESTPAASSNSSSEGGNQGSMNPLVLGLIIAGVAIVVIVIIIIAVHGHGKAKKAARKVLKKGAKSITKSSSKTSSSNKKRK